MSLESRQTQERGWEEGKWGHFWPSPADGLGAVVCFWNVSYISGLLKPQARELDFHASRVPSVSTIQGDLG